MWTLCLFKISSNAFVNTVHTMRGAIKGIYGCNLRINSTQFNVHFIFLVQLRADPVSGETIFLICRIPSSTELDSPLIELNFPSVFFKISSILLFANTPFYFVIYSFFLLFNEAVKWLYSFPFLHALAPVYLTQNPEYSRSEWVSEHVRRSY